MRDEKKTKAQLIEEIKALRQQLRLSQTSGADGDPDPPRYNPEALRRSEERFHRVFHASPIGISLSLLEDGKIINANESFMALFGLNRQELIGKTSYDLNMWSSHKQREQVMNELMQKGSVRDLLLRYPNRGGEKREVLVSFDLIELEGKPHVLGFHVDITDRNHIAKDLHRQLAENARLLQQANRRAREMGSLMQISAALRQTSHRNQMIPILINETRDISNAAAAGIILRQEDSLMLTGTTIGGVVFKEEISIDDACGSLWNAVQSGTPLFLTCKDTCLETCPALRKLMQEMQTGAFIPLKTASAILGLLYVTFHGNAEQEDDNVLFSPELRRLLEAIADIGANALHRANIMESLERRVIERSRQIATLYEITTIASNPHDLQTTLQLVLEKVLEAMHSPTGTIHLKEDAADVLRLTVSQGLSEDIKQGFHCLPVSEDLWGEDIRHARHPIILSLSPKPAFLKNLAIDQFTLYIGAPIRAKGEITGLLGVLGQTYRTYTSEDMVQLMAIADQIGVIVENARLRKQAEQAAIIEERQRLSRELHDSVNQLLYSLALFARGGRNYMETNQWKLVAQSLIDIDETAQQALKEMRLLLYELRPAALEQAGLREALRYRLETVEQRAGVQTQLILEDGLALPIDIEKDLYRVAQEALNNALKHASANRITIKLSSSEKGGVKLEISDNGRGFDPKTSGRGLGLSIMRERMMRLGGSLTIISSPGEGTRVVAELDRLATSGELS